MDFPESIKYGDLREPCAEYRPDLIERYEDLYQGGERFKKNIDKYLDRRALESAAAAKPNLGVEEPDQSAASAAAFAGVMASKRWDERKKVSRYTNYAAGLLDYFVSAIFYNELMFLSDDPFWAQFSTDADGNGRDCTSLLRSAALDLLKHRRTFLALQAPEVYAPTLEVQRAMGGLDVRLSTLRAVDVDMWQETNGKYDWVRTYRADEVRTVPYGKPDLVRELWTYVTGAEIIEYELMRQADKDPENDWPVVLKSRKLHGFSRMPVFPIVLPCGLWAMQRLEDPILKLYNRESGITWAINTAAFQLLAVKTQGQLANIVDVALGGVRLSPGDDIQFVGPQAPAFDAQFHDRDDLKRNLYEVFQSMGLNALATQTQNARQSAAAKELDREPMSALLRTFASAMRDALEQIAIEIANYRAGSVPELRGLDRFDLATLKEKFENLISARSISGYPESAYRWQLKDAALTVASNAPADIRQAISDEISDAVIDDSENDAEEDDIPATPAAARTPARTVTMGGTMQVIE